MDVETLRILLLAVLGLPGSFGRYLQRYQQRGQLGLFLRRTSFWTFTLAGSTLALMIWRRAELAELVFGEADRAGLMIGVICCLATVILHHFLEAVFAGLRISLAIAVILMVVSELYATTNGIGFRMLQSQRSFKFVDSWAAIIVLGALGALLNAALSLIERRVLRWSRVDAT